MKPVRVWVLDDVYKTVTQDIIDKFKAALKEAEEGDGNLVWPGPVKLIIADDLTDSFCS